MCHRSNNHRLVRIFLSRTHLISRMRLANRMRLTSRMHRHSNRDRVKVQCLISLDTSLVPFLRATRLVDLVGQVDPTRHPT